MTKIIEVTEAGGTMWLDKDRIIRIDADQIHRISKPGVGYVGNSVITMNDNKIYNVRETEKQIRDLINPPNWFIRLFKR